MIITFDTLIDEVISGKATRLVDRPVGPSGIRLLIVQREAGDIWEADDRGERIAEPWDLPVLQRVYLGMNSVTKFSDALDYERLGRFIALLTGQDRAEAERIEEWAAVRAAERLIAKARAS